MKKTKNDDRLFVLAYDRDGCLIHYGRVEHEAGESIRMECYSAMDLVLIGQFVSGGELKDVPRKNCRLFKSFDGFEEAVGRGVRCNEEKLSLGHQIADMPVW